MKKLIFASMRENAGKTSMIVGIARASNKDFGYMKPLGDRLLYSKKRLWDYDSAVMSNVFGLTDDPGEMSIGFDHSKLSYMYDEEGMKAKLLETVSQTGSDKDVLLIEAGRDLIYGTSVYLDAISLARSTVGTLVIVLSGEDDIILDELTFLKNHIALSDVEFGVIINKLHDIENFKDTYLPGITDMGIKVLGMVPHAAELTQFSVGYLVERLFAKILAGEARLKNIVQSIFVGAVSVNAALRNPSVKKEKILTVTSGDRTDVILAALESNSAGVVLTNNIEPPSNIISRAAERNVPLLLVPTDTYDVARQIGNLQPLLTTEDSEKIDLLEDLVRQHVNIGELV